MARACYASERLLVSSHLTGIDYFEPAVDSIVNFELLTSRNLIAYVSIGADKNMVLDFC